MSYLKSFVIVLVGILMGVIYMMILVAFAKFAEHVAPTFGILLFLAFAVVTALCLIKMQTLLERYLIRRHVAQHPNSSWRYIVAK